MADPFINEPVAFSAIDWQFFAGDAALEDRRRALYTLAAFMLMCGMYMSPEAKSGDEEMARREDRASEDWGYDDDLAVLGLSRVALFERSELIDFDDLDERTRAELLSSSAGETTGAEDFYTRFLAFCREALGSGRADVIRRTVALGLNAPDSLVAASALRSAVDLIRLPLDLVLRIYHRLIARSDEVGMAQVIAGKALEVVTARALGTYEQAVAPFDSTAFQGGVASWAFLRRLFTPTPILPVHGTHFPFDRRPEWSVPNFGRLYQYIKPHRPGLVDRDRYFRWEGGYSDYAREVAADNLSRWLTHSGLDRCDAITHSHGGNVLLKSTHFGARYRKALLMNCPVHRRYTIASGSCSEVVSLRVRLDLVIAADRGGQKFGAHYGIQEHILPVWFEHGALTQPEAWRQYGLIDHLRPY